MGKLLKISEFARISGIARKNLIYYDTIGLLSPEQVLENGYRFYSYHQLETVTVIAALQELGMPLKTIKVYLDNRTPDTLLSLFTVQRHNIDKKIRRLQGIQRMIDTRLAITERALTVDASKMSLQFCEDEHLFSSSLFNCSNTLELGKAMEAFYDFCDSRNIIYGYPLGTVVLCENLLKGNWRYPSHFFFTFPPEEGELPMLHKPAGLYLIAYETEAYEGPVSIYGRIFDFVNENKLTIVGNSYEEYLLDEIALKNSKGYLLRVSVQVSKLDLND